MCTILGGYSVEKHTRAAVLHGSLRDCEYHVNLSMLTCRDAIPHNLVRHYVHSGVTWFPEGCGTL